MSFVGCAIESSYIDPLEDKIPEIIGGEHGIIRAVDGLQFGTRNAL